jgi:hypothetical protein
MIKFLLVTTTWMYLSWAWAYSGELIYFLVKYFMLKQYKLLFLLKLSFPLQFFLFASFEVIFALQV